MGGDMFFWGRKYFLRATLIEKNPVCDMERKISFKHIMSTKNIVLYSGAGKKERGENISDPRKNIAPLTLPLS